MYVLKKVIILILIITLSIVIVKFGYKIYEKNIYSLENMQKILNEVKLPEKYNVEEIVYDSSNNISEKIYYYINEKEGYISQEYNGEKDCEQMYNFENSTHITIIHTEKMIIENVIENGNDKKMYSLDSFMALANLAKKNQCEYKYEGKEDNSFKISFFNISGNSVGKTIFYIDCNTYYIVKIESYMENNRNILELKQISTYEYFPNIENENNIVKFNIENYPDYHYVKGIK